MKTSPRLFLVSLLGLTAAACAKHDEAAPAALSAGVTRHEHKAPHDGTPVVLGQEAYHLELVRDPATGGLSAYVLDGEMEKFIRIPARSLEIVATVAGQPRPLILNAVANSATGETVGDTAQFDGQADWLKRTSSFEAVLTAIEIRGTKFEHVAFNFPKGNDKD